MRSSPRERLKLDVVLLDIQLPDLDGSQSLTSWRAPARALDVVLISSRDAETAGARLRRPRHAGSWPSEICPVRRWLSSSAEHRRPPAGLPLVPAGLVVGILAERAAFDWDDPRPGPRSCRRVDLHLRRFVRAPRRPGAGWLLAATGFAWFEGELDSGLVYLHRGPLVHGIVAYSGWRARTCSSS